MDPKKKLALIKSFAEEIITEEELVSLLSSKKRLIAYDGFEPSGNPHIAQGIIRAINVNKMTKAGIRFKMFVADWHAWANNKYGGDLEKIQTCGKYLTEIWKAQIKYWRIISKHCPQPHQQLCIATPPLLCVVHQISKYKKKGRR